MKFWFGDELRSARTPEVVGFPDVDDTKINKRAKGVEVFGRRCNDLRFIGRSAAAAIDRYPNVFQTQKRRFTFSQHCGSENITIKRDGRSYIGDDQRDRY